MGVSKPVIKALKPSAIASTGPFAHVTHTTGASTVIFTSGMVGQKEDGSIPESYVEQIKQSLVNLQHCLEAAGATVKDVLKLTYYIVNYDPNNRPHAAIIFEWLGGHRPATALVPVPCLANPKFLFEIEAVAAARNPALATPLSPPQPGRVDEYDVIVVGAGLSGLQAAYDLQKAGLKTIVLEARDRVGGKTWTVPTADGKGFIDLGGAWINDTNQSKMWALGQRFGMEYIVQTTSGDCALQGYGRFPFGELPPFESEDEKQNFASFRDLVEETCQTIDIERPWIGIGKYYDSMTFDEFAKRSGATEKTLEYANLWVRAMVGIDGTEISALYFLHYCKSGGGFKQMRSDGKHGGQHLRSKTGSQPYSEGLAALLTPGSVILSTPVTGIRQSGTSCTVETTQLALRSKKVIVSVPTPLYKDITFNPPLSGDKLQLSSSTRLGYFSKMILVYSSPWWTEAGYAGLAHSFNTSADGKTANGAGPVTLVRDTSDPEAGVYALTCFPVANAGREWSKLPASQRRAEVLAHVAQAYADVPRHLIYSPVEVFEQEWAKEEWSKGCPCPVTPPGILSTVGHCIRQPTGNVHFVGTETSVVWKGYMEGAVRSGERGAKEVIEALSHRIASPKANL